MPATPDVVDGRAFVRITAGATAEAQRQATGGRPALALVPRPVEHLIEVTPPGSQYGADTPQPPLGVPQPRGSWGVGLPLSSMRRGEAGWSTTSSEYERAPAAGAFVAAATSDWSGAASRPTGGPTGLRLTAEWFEERTDLELIGFIRAAVNELERRRS